MQLTQRVHKCPSSLESFYLNCLTCLSHLTCLTHLTFREGVHVSDGGEVPDEDLHGEQGQDRQTQPEGPQGREDLLPQDEPLRRSGKVRLVRLEDDGKMTFIQLSLTVFASM